MKLFITTLKNTDKRFWVGIPTMGFGLGLMLVAAHRDGINDTLRALEAEYQKNKKIEENN